MTSAPFNTAASIRVRQLADAEWPLLRDLYTGVHGVQGTRAFLDGRDPDQGENWMGSAQGYVNFGLFDADKIIGTTSVHITPYDEAVFTGFLIHPDYRGLHLTNPLYEAGKQYLRDMHYTGELAVAVIDNNTPSLRAALSNGFTPKAEYTLDDSSNLITLGARL